ncbi:MAG: helicase-related protein [Gemmataceae bacterium]
MTELKPFQELTVRAVMTAFNRHRRRRRFLVADEVGLGKTVVAQHVVRRMFSGLGRPLVVFYMCSNLAIARQNRRKLLEILPVEERENADCPVDRLSLLGAGERPTHRQFHLYSLTPDTSIPIRKRQRRDGRKEERALVHALIEKVCPGLLEIWGEEVFRGGATTHWESSVAQQREKAAKGALRDSFLQSVRKEFELAERQHLLPEIRSRYESGELDALGLIAHLRNALAASAIEEVQPDLVIFDEFQRFRDLLDPQEDAVAQRVIGPLRGDGSANPPALLLLSATPYRLFTRRWEEETGTSHRNEFFELVEFLYGGDSVAKQKRKQCEDAFVGLESELRKGHAASDGARKARLDVEALLCPIIARTERASHQHGWDDFQTECLSAPVAPEDLSIFKHLTHCFEESYRASAVPYWTSIPIPMQTMGNHYVAWKSAVPAAADATPHLTEEMRNNHQTPPVWPHPRLRSLQQLAKPEQLAVPWLPPTAPWWTLRGVWKQSLPTPRKLLVFSRFRAVPQAIAATISYDLESSLLSDDNLSYSDVSRRRLLSATESRHALVGLFHTSPFLINATDPLAARSSDLQAIRRVVQRQLKAALDRLGIAIRNKGPSLPPWKLLARLDYAEGNWCWIMQAWRWIHAQVTTGLSEDSGLAQLLDEWDAVAHEPLECIRPDNFRALVDYALGSPGVVVGRSLKRHWAGAVSDDRDSKGQLRFRHTLAASWMGLRNYLDQRWFYRVLCKEKEHYPDALQRVVVDGNLEAVLDEHLWIVSRLRDLSQDELAIELREGLTLKSGMFFLHPLQGRRDDTFSLRCHVAMPFVQAKVQTPGEDEKPIRTDEMRRAFNTPFWPYILTTTSVGQEGLDFHAWCDTLVHWDLCRNPVDLEQREGRIQRFGGLSIRRAIAANLAEAAMANRSDGESPWVRIESMANARMSDESGLAPWWVCKNGGVIRYVFDVPTSEQKHWLHWMKEQRLLYRLALGQPNQEDLLEILSSKVGLDPQAIRKAVINLSPWFRATAR